VPFFFGISTTCALDRWLAAHKGASGRKNERLKVVEEEVEGGDGDE
jgi:hypothetical protein